MDRLIRDIVAYMQHLKERYSLDPLLHDAELTFAPYIQNFVPFIYHSNPYCLSIRSNATACTRCACFQHELLEQTNREPFAAMCFAGVEEYVFPIGTEKPMGYLSVGGYCSDREKGQACVRQLAQEDVFDEEKLLKIHQDALKPLPPFEEVRTVVQPLCHMLAALAASAPTIYEEHPAQNAHNSDYIYGHIILFLHHHFRQRLTVEDLSKLCYCSPSYVSHLLKKRSGKTVSEYLNMLRIEEAKKILVGTTFSMNMVASMVGYTDSNYFSTVFKKYAGISPKKYRALHMIDFHKV